MIRVLSLGVLLLAASMAGAGPQLFDAQSFAEIRAHHARAPVLVMLWSVECTYCKADMRRAAERLQAHPELALVLINVDPLTAGDAVREAIHETGTEAAEHWQFGDLPPARLRASIDPHWYGELPRTYLVDANGAIEGRSGRLPEAAFDHWQRLGNR